jgi:FkbM family methyltransferase
MIFLLKKILKKNIYIYKLSKLLYLSILHSLIKIISFRKDFFLKRNPKKEKKIKLLNHDFYFSKYSATYNVMFKNFEKSIQTLKDSYNLLSKDFFEKEINIILDVGANIGYQSLFYNHYFKNKVNILCFEPHTINYHYLKLNLESFKNIKLFNFALGATNKEDYIAIPNFESHRKSNFGLMAIGQKSSIFKEKIFIKKFDDLNIFFKREDEIYVKIDVEGYEQYVLDGMSNFLKTCNKIYICIEINRNYNNEASVKKIINFLNLFNFKFFMIKNHQLLKMEKELIINNASNITANIYCKK